MIAEQDTEDRADLGAGRTRVRNFCFTCPFHEADPSGAKERSGNPKILCKHPATWVPLEPLKVEIGEHGFIPHNCPLRVQPLTVFLDPKDDA
jgi:hypothetical protein